jgi:hypothetical protein
MIGACGGVPFLPQQQSTLGKATICGATRARVVHSNHLLSYSYWFTALLCLYRQADPIVRYNNTHSPCATKKLCALHHHVFTSSRDGRAGQERAHPLPILLRMVSRQEAKPSRVLTQTVPTSCSPAKTSLRTSSCSRAAHVPSPKKRLLPASCATTSPRPSELQPV